MSQPFDLDNPYRAPSTLGKDPAELRDETELVLASPAIRLVAVLIDWVIQALLVLPGMLMLLWPLVELVQEQRTLSDDELMFELARRTNPVTWAVLILPMVILMVIQIVLLVKNGQTVGKKIVGIRIGNVNGVNPGFWHIFILRGIVSGLPGFIPYFGYVYTLVDPLFIFSERHRCIHDRIAGTLVVKA